MPAFTYGWKDEGNPSSEFWIRFDRCSREPGPFKDEVYAAARKIADSSDRPLWLCMSGGIDSEVMALAFYEQKIPFNVLTFRHKSGTNDFDIQFAVHWCKERGIRQKIYEIDMEAFYKEDMKRLIDEGYISGKPYHYMKIKMLEMIEEMGGFGVVGSGEQRYIVDPSIKDPKPGDAHLDLGVGYVASVEWLRRTGLKHEPFFLHHTPELNFSFLNDIFIRFVLQHPYPFRSLFNRFYIKQFVYHTIWLDMVPRVKYTGFEYIKPISRDVVKRLEEQFGDRIQSCKIPIPDLIRQLQPLTSKV